MLVPMRWLKEFVKINEEPEELAQKLTMSGSNVEGIEYWGKDIKGIIIGEIEKIEKHPDADKLLIVYVNTGNETIQIVTGATNVREKNKVPVALNGSIIAGGKKIRKSKFRGVDSWGMLCSAEELGLDDHGLPPEMREGILILPEDAPVGTDIKDYLPLEDAVIDFEITPNRPDCLSIIGMARETAATLKSELTIPKIALNEEGEEFVKDKVTIKIEAEDLCKRYTARIIKDIKIEPSPLWMQRRLQTCGIRSINNIVDITNYVMLETGQPLHAFDYDKIRGNSIIVRRARPSEELETLDGNIRELNEDMLVIADKSRALGLAGVMGGADSEITSSTRNVLIESANFFGPNIRRTSRQLGLRSESSMRFEKGLDPNICLMAADRACQLIEQLGAGKVLKGCVDVFPAKPAPREIAFSPDRINKVLGTSIPQDEMIDILRRLEIDVRHDSGILKAIVPTFRQDLVEEADLVEEIGRMYGYDKLPTTLPYGNVTQGKLDDYQKYIDDIKDVLVYNGYFETYTYSFVSPKVFDIIKTPNDSPLRKAIELLNPLGEERSIMRTTLLPNMLDTISFNLNHKAEELRFFEISSVYLPKQLPLKELPVENKRIVMGLCGESMNYYDLKKAIETIFTKLRIKNWDFIPASHFAFHTSRCAKILIGDKEIGFVGEVHPDVLENYEINKKVYAAELDLDTILENASNKVIFKPLPKFPASERDLAIVVDERVLARDIIKEICESGKPLLESVELFDVYQGGQIAKGYKSMAFSLVFRAPDRTLTDIEVNEVFEKIEKSLKDKFNASLRE